jgi:predicted DNA-binding transcriptional regulator AlpA
VKKQHRKPATQAAIAKRAGKLKAEDSKPVLSPKLTAANQACIASRPDSRPILREIGTILCASTVAPPAHQQVTAARQATGVPAQLYGRREIVALTGLSYPTLWKMACRGEFPRARIVGGKSMWLAVEINAWLAGLPIRRLKGDPNDEQRTTELRTEEDDLRMSRLISKAKAVP